MEIIAPEKKSYTLESYGKFRLHQARSLDDYMFSINLFKEAIEQHEDNYMAMYETGCAYRKLWGFVENHRQTEYGEISGTNDRQRTLMPPFDLLDKTRIPAPYKCVPSYEFFKCHNPVSRAKENPYLLESLSHFKKANEKTNHTNPLILVELARTWVSLGHVEEALSCFATAENAVFGVFTITYMFEQRALFVEKLSSDESCTRSKNELLLEVDTMLKYYR